MERKIKHIMKSGWMCLLLLLLLPACGQEEPVPGYFQGGEATFSLHPVAEPMKGGVATRSSGEAAPVINEYTVLVFRKSGGGTPSENKLVMKMRQDGGGELVFTAEQTQGEHYIYVFANAENKLDGLSPNVSNEQQLLDIQIDAGRTPEGSVALSDILGSSKITLPDFSVADFYQATTGRGEVPLKRIVARMTIHFSVSPEIFSPEAVTYYSMTGGNTYLVGRKNTGAGDYMQESITRVGNTWEQPMYLYDQASIRNGEKEEWKNKGFFLVFKGKYKGGETQYFKFALPGVGVTFGDINRNVSYALDITDIKNDGYTSPSMAENPNTLFSNVVVSIIPDMTGMENFKELYTNGYYMLGINSSEFHFYHALGPTVYGTMSNTQPYLLTEVNYKPLNSSVSSDKPSLLSGYSSELTLLHQTSGLQGERYYLLFTPSVAPPSLEQDVQTYTAMLSYGTLRKLIKVSVHPVTPNGGNAVMKYQASNGNVHKFSYGTVSAGGTAYNNPVIDLSWTWASSDWCGIASNSRYDPSNYFGEIAASLDENIFIHLRTTALPLDAAGMRQVFLIADDHVVDVRIGRVLGQPAGPG